MERDSLLEMRIVREFVALVLHVQQPLSPKYRSEIREDRGELASKEREMKMRDIRKCCGSVVTKDDGGGAELESMKFTNLHCSDTDDFIRARTLCEEYNYFQSKLPQTLYCKQQKNSVSIFDLSTSSERLLNLHLQKLAMDCHRFSMQEGPINVFQWKGHSVG
ncbi:hypothetical protein HYC85_010482 [Camellia sinensis]|uniref:Uncharacterized protein n=1 Tax=Camellia sinensis TaxID=4442 RepID=A0A7J7HKM9_CAMSI|nr:hypothetical protein HYC85_010482 [Camellia sinensis]